MGLGCWCAGDATVCNPKTVYECTLLTLENYVRDNEAAVCNCPRQCRHLSYNREISQAITSNRLMMFAKAANEFNGTLDELRFDYCALEVSERM